MSRSRRRRHTSSEVRRGDVFHPTPSAPLLDFVVRATPSAFDLLDLPPTPEDGRFFYPSRGRDILDYPAPRRVSGEKVRVVPRSRQVTSTRRISLYSPPPIPAGLRFERARGVVVCVRRKERREVLFARGVGGSRMRKRNPRRTVHSFVSCRR